MPQVLKLKIAGLYTHPNTLSEVPEGALQIADNIVIDRESLAETRRGFKQYGDALTSEGNKLFSYLETLLLNYGSNLAYDNGSGVFTDLTGTFDAPSTDLRIQSTSSNNNFYLTTALGVQKMDSPSSNPIRSGVGRGLDIVATLAGAGTAVQDDCQVAYRVLFGYRDANKNLILGTPSHRAILINSSGSTQDVNVDFSVPPGLPTGSFFQVYRSFPSVDASTPPDDELQLVAEVDLASLTLPVLFTDDVPLELLGAALYTNATQEGILQTNDRPPYAIDVTSFKNFTFYGNTKQPNRIVASFLTKPVVNDTITLGLLSYTAKAAENIAAHEFKVFSTGNLATDILNTVISFTRVVNRDSRTIGLILRAVSLGGASFLAEEIGFSFTFSLSSSNPAVFGKTYNSDNEVKRNRVYISKLQRPEAVPAINFIDVGRADKDLLRLIALRDAVFVLKEDGIFRITGDDLTNFAEEPHDTTYEIIGPECATKLANHVFCASNQGIIAISLSGVTIVSRPIEKDLLKIIELSSFSKYAWAVGYDSDRKYILGVPSPNLSSKVQFAYVYNTMTASWTKYIVPWTNALVNDADDKLYAIRNTDDQILKERKDLKISDYADDEFDVDITAVSDNIVTLLDATNAIEGMTLVQGANKAIVIAVNGNDLTLNSTNIIWEVDVAILYTPILSKIRWTEEHAGNPGLNKLWSEITFMFETANFREIKFRVSTNFVSSFVETILEAEPQGLPWGSFPWGSLPWGQASGGGFQGIRTYFPREQARGLWSNMELELEEAFTTFGLAGASYVVEPMSTRFK